MENLLFIGKSFSGKSHLSKYLLYRLALAKKFHYAALISTTGQFNWTCIPNNWMFKPSQCQQLLSRMFNYHDHLQKQGIQLQGILIIDDCLGAINFRDEFWTQVVTTCKQFGISIWIITQYLNKVPPVIRASTSYYFFLKMISKRELDACYDQCFPWISKSEFDKFIQKYLFEYHNSAHFVFQFFHQYLKFNKYH